jgi:hypothetical protein
LASRPEDINPAQLEKALNYHLKGWYYLSRELCRVFKDRGSGTLAFIVPEGPPSKSGDSPDLLGPALGAAFKSFAQSVLALPPPLPYEAYGFSAENADPAAFAAFIFKIIDEGGRRNAGRWHKYGRVGLFGR